MSRPRDLQIFWVVLIAGAFWVSIWQHDAMAKLWKTVSTAAVAMTSGIRPPAQPQSAPTDRETSATSTKSSPKR